MTEEERKKQLGFVADINAMMGRTPQGKAQPPAQAVQTSIQQTRNVRGAAPAYTPPSVHGQVPPIYRELNDKKKKAQEMLRNYLKVANPGSVDREDMNWFGQKTLQDQMSLVAGLGDRRRLEGALAPGPLDMLIGGGVMPSVGLGMAGQAPILTGFNEPVKMGGKQMPWGHHNGLDLAANPGTPITAPEAGVIYPQTTSQQGILLKGRSGVSTTLGHVGRFNVRPGQYVTPGQIIAYAGTGYTGTAPTPEWGHGQPGDNYDDHLHASTYIPGGWAAPSMQYVDQKAGLFNDPRFYLYGKK